MNRNLFGRKHLWPNQVMCLEGLRKTTKSLSHNCWCPSFNSKWRWLKYKTSVLPLQSLQYLWLTLFQIQLFVEEILCIIGKKLITWKQW